MSTIRIDKWLWHARFFKTRTLAQSFVAAGKVRINELRIEKPGYSVKIGDVLTFVKGHDVRVIEVAGIGVRRGPATEAATLYNDLSPPSERNRDRDPSEPAPVAERERGSGRPTKRERREIDRLRET